MSGKVGEPSGSKDDRSEPQHALSGVDFDRLEEIGDLHAQASAFSSALEYYRRLLDEPSLLHQPLTRACGVLRKCIDAALGLGDLSMAESLLERATQFLGEPELSVDERALLLAPLMGRRAIVLSRRNSHTEALKLAKHAFTILAVTDSHGEVASLQVTMGVCHHRLGRLDKAQEFYTDALGTYRRIGDEVGRAKLLNNLALLHKNGCRWNQALDLLAKAVEIARHHGATHLLSYLYLNRGIVLTKIDHLDEARAELEKSLRISRSLGNRPRLARVLLAFAALEIAAGRLVRAEELALEGQLVSDQEGLGRESTIADELLGDVQLARGDVDKALHNYSLGLRAAGEYGKINDLEGELLRRVAEAQRQQGELDRAVETGEAALAVCEKCGEAYEIGFCHRTMGLALVARGDLERGDTQFRRAISVFKQQNLPRHWVESILAFLDARLATAGQAELLLIKRFLTEAQESTASTVDDRRLCRLQQGLAEVQLRLGQYDDALLSIYELERNAAGLGDTALNLAITDLRCRVERSLLGQLDQTEQHLQAISGIPGIFSWSDNSIPRNLASVLRAGMERVRADHGFIAMEWAGVVDQPVRIVARDGLSENLAEQLARWYRSNQTGVDPGASVLFSRLTGQEPLLKAVPALQEKARSCVFMPITLEGRRFGVLFLGKSNLHGSDSGFGRPQLDFLATYMGFLALFLFEKGRGRLPGEAARTPTPIEGLASFENIITENDSMLEVLSLARKVAPSDLTVLISGETGTGKGLLAYSIHALSRRGQKRFLAINCAAIPESLLESELFGHVKGSFTGAINDKRGLLAEAEGGTVFLDEIGKMPLSMQGKVLHFLDTKVIRAVGSNQDRRVDVRIICASKSNLQELSARGLFLEDLYYRLLDFPLTVPPLRERRDDIQLLAHHFIERFAQELGMAPPGYTAAFMEALTAHNWPGNVRELEKCLRRAIVLAQGERVLKPGHLPTEVAVRPGPDREAGEIAPLRETLAVVEAREIAQVLKVTRGNKSEASRLLGISYPNLLKKIRFYGLGSD